MSEPQHHHHHHHRESQLRRILRTYKFEIFGLIVIILGIFLVLERLSIRNTLSGWLRRASAVALHGTDHVGEHVSASLAHTTVSDAFGFLLIVGALAVIFMRLRWRLMHDPALAVLQCPKCHGGIHRTHRRGFDRMVSLFVPVRRYRCTNAQCRWCGLRVGTGHGASRTSVHESS